MDFFFNAKPYQSINPQTGQYLKAGNYGDAIGLGTQYNGELTFSGCFSFFEINFKPTGFNKIFLLPARQITNQIINTEAILDSSVKRFFDQLSSANGLIEMGLLADAYLLSYLKKQKSINYKDPITHTSNLILKNAGCINVEQLASNANMSLRGFEGHFMEQVGISPKLFCCITRFNHALDLKLKNPKKDWTSIAYECGYFDQMHLIKDFRKFSGNSPSIFLKQTPLTQENYTSRVEA